MQTFIKSNVWALLCLCSQLSIAQTLVQGRVLDAQSKEPLVGASIMAYPSPEGATTDFNGDFTLASERVDSLRVSYIGYQSQWILPNQSATIYLAVENTQLNQIIVTASRDKQERKEAPMAISSLGATVLAESKATSLDQIINKAPGVMMVDLGNEQHSMSMRQPLSLGSLFLYMEDGLPIRTIGVFNHNALIETNMVSVRSIELVKGPSSSIYGSEAIGGAINFISHSPTWEPQAFAQVQANNLGYKRSDFRISNRWNKFGVVASGYLANRQKGPRAHTDFSKAAFTLRGDTYLGANTQWINSLNYIDYTTDMTGALDSAGFFGKEYSSLHTFTNRTVRALRYRSTLEHFWNSQSTTSLTFFYRDNVVGQNPAYRVKDDYKPWNGSGNPLLAHGEVNANTFKSYGGLVQHQQSFHWWNARLISGASVDISPNDYTAHYIRINKNEQGQYISFDKTDSLLANYQVGILNYAIYNQLEISPIPNMKVVAGVRYDAINYRYDNHLSPSAFSGAPDNTDRFRQITPRVGLTYDFGKGIGAYANWSKGFAPPQITDLYRGVKVPELKAAFYTNMELGGWMPLPKNKGYVEVSAYQLLGFNEIIDVKQDDGSTEKKNAGSTAHKGLEYNLVYKPLPDWQVRVGGAYAQHRFVDFVEKGSDFSDKEMPAAPKHIYNVEVNYKPRFIKGFRLSMEVQHMGSYYLDQANTEQYDGFNLLHVGAGYHYKGFELWTSIRNLGNVNYATVVNKSAWGKSYNLGDPRTFNVGLSYQLVNASKL
ncbi:TonB-dependent receptor [Cytophagales bacterium LB-30]|uniref:TonB-dependent receptor n=1 Tax=Shiella aurantiaca TaxID=3058365 RepID=A0ABT8F3R8_9BACT|nr:TonB-dependent receptor [Shiella aurantiaca]MDN4165023.1 TonB-dependent receptor [Shiella aurantiaca]